MTFDILKKITLFSNNSLKFKYAGVCWWAELIKLCIVKIIAVYCILQFLSNSCVL